MEEVALVGHVVERAGAVDARAPAPEQGTLRSFRSEQGSADLDEPWRTARAPYITRVAHHDRFRPPGRCVDALGSCPKRCRGPARSGRLDRVAGGLLPTSSFRGSAPAGRARRRDLRGHPRWRALTASPASTPTRQASTRSPPRPVSTASPQEAGHAIGLARRWAGDDRRPEAARARSVSAVVQDRRGQPGPDRGPLGHRSWTLSAGGPVHEGGPGSPTPNGRPLGLLVSHRRRRQDFGVWAR